LIVEDYNIVSRAKSISENVVAGANLQDSAGSNRIFIWKEIMKLFPKCWAFGMGPDHLIYANIPLGTGLVDKAHNIYLEMLITLGAFALISYLVFIIGIIELSAKKNSIMYRLMIISYLLQGFFNIDVIMVLPLFWIILGFALSEGTEKINNTICACETSL
jgi:O-antigen ligase